MSERTDLFAMAWQHKMPSLRACPAICACRTHAALLVLPCRFMQQIK